MELTMSVPLSKAEQVKQAIMEMIVREKMMPGAQFPTEVELMERLSVSRVTVRKAMNSLSDQGVFLRTKGKGTCISPDFEQSAAGWQIQQYKDNSPRAVGIILSVLTDDYFRLIAAACERELNAAGIATVFWSAIESQEMLKQLKNNYRHLDGLIINPPDTDFPSMLRQNLPHLPTVFVNESASSKIDCVSSDDCAGTYQAVKYLYTLGHRRIAHIHGPLNTITGTARRKGYLDAMTDCGLARYIQEEASLYNEKTGYAAMKKLLVADHRPEALICANDYVAAGAYAAATEAGLRLPEDLSVIGYGNQRVGIELSPRLTTVDQHPDLIGIMAAGFMMQHLNQQNHCHKEIQIPVSLIFRDSCISRIVK